MPSAAPAPSATVLEQRPTPRGARWSLPIRSGSVSSAEWQGRMGRVVRNHEAGRTVVRSNLDCSNLSVSRCRVKHV